MTLLILHRNPLEPFPYDRWLADFDGDVVILAARDKFESFAEEIPTTNLGYAHFETMDFRDDALVLKRALELAAEFGTKYVIGHHEGDVDNAARVREERGLPGPWTADVYPFRDKALMKKLVQKVGVEVAPHTVPQSPADVREFAREHGFPLVFKDRAGFNAIGLRILREQAELDAYLEEPLGDVLLEAFVPGRMCHVDGLVVGGETVLSWPSQYQYDLASFGSDPGARVDVTLDPDDPLTDRLIALTDKTLAALRTPGLQNHGFHAEIFHTPDDRLVLCEIASRPAGAKVREVFKTLFDVNLAEYATRLQVGLPIPAIDRTPKRMSGQVLMMKRPGVIHEVPQTPEDAWVEYFWLYAKPGQVVPPAGGSSDFLVAAVASAPTRSECERRLRELGARFVAQTKIGDVA
ncbi:hypothetical protein [Amycolatopsis sp. NPDC059657]|uniref:ATP-binding protein n=1 Tax=Amycolatopsis sp. NPDC059657 TaxID=3346899 RepID=UPI003671EF97